MTSKDYQQLIKHLKSPEPAADLFSRIMRRIHSEKKILNLKRRVIFFSFGLIISLLVLVPAFKMVRAEFIESGFIDFFSLLFSDFGAVLTCWQSFVLTLLESLPVMSAVVFLLVIFLFLESLKFLVRDMKIVFHINNQ